jgi:hypothetical protein
VNSWLEERRERRRRRTRRARRIGIPLFTVLLVVSLVLAPFSFIEARRDGEFFSWFVFAMNVLTALLSASWLWLLDRMNSSRGSGTST